MPSLWELLGASPEGAATLDARTGALAGSYGRSAFDALTLPAREIAGNFAGAASTNNQEYQNAMQGWRYADPPPGVKVVELDGATYWQMPDGRYAEPQRVNIAGLLPMGQNEQTGAVSMETGRLLPLVQGYMGSEIGTSLSAPKGALGAGAGRVADQSPDYSGDVAKIVAEYGGKLRGQNGSALSNSQYLSFEGIPTHLPKSARREFFALFPKASGAEAMGDFTVRVSDHPNVSGRGTSMFTLRTDRPIEPQVEYLRRMIEFLKTKAIDRRF